MTQIYDIPFTQSKNHRDRDLDCNLDSNLDRNPEFVRVYGTFIAQYKKAHHNVFHCSVIVTSKTT